MGKNYDNWERLVKAVSRREEDKLLALTHSVSTSPFDRKDWKVMLPPGKRQVVWRSSYMSFSLDERTEKNCFLLGAMNLIMSSRGFGGCWKLNTHPQSRFTEVVEFEKSQGIYIEGNIKTKLLSSESCYTAYLVFGFAEMYANLNSAVSIVRNFYNESGIGYPEEQAKMVKFQEGNDRDDGWMEIQLGEFYVDEGGNGEVQVQLLDTSGYIKSGLILEGIEFRPF
ncbi:F-box protein PP2-B5-like [Salvia divinorum]|uniref:F-box protein PP2-B5-like n=1 Tax=Salvia divinorum TaxID=28513 RepID=A0ABD1GW47_SALDI